jgi:hypothetical protein
MLKPIRLVVLLISMLSSFGVAGQFTEMESSFIRGTGTPKEESKSFSVYNPLRTFSIKVHNGLDGKARVNSAAISVNGKEIFSPNDFKGQTEWLEKPINLKKMNSLKVTLKSQPGSAVAIQFYGIDNTPPVITFVIPINNSTIRTTTPVVTLAYLDIHSGVVTKTLKILVNGIDRTSNFRNNEIGALWKIPQNMALPVGLNTVSATITDRAGNVGHKQIQFTVKISNPAPLVSITSPANGAITNETPINVAWTVNSVAQNTQTTENLVEGTNKIKRGYTDQAGNTGTDSVTVVLDTKPPVVVITLPANELLTNKASLPVAWTVDGVPQTTQLTQALVEGDNTITRIAIDAAGNVDTASVRVTLDTKPPVVVITSPKNGLLTNKTPTAVLWTVDGVEQTTLLTENLAEGANTVTRTATDAAGNSGTDSITVSLDTKPPVVAILSPANGITTDKSQIAISWSIDGVVQDTQLLENLADGVNTITRTATDAAGNTGTATITVIRQNNLSVNVLSPVENEYVKSPNIPVFGELLPSKNSFKSVTVNDLPVQFDGNKFYTNNVRLDSLKDTILIRAVPLIGSIIIKKIPVSLEQISNYISVFATTYSGVDSLELKLHISATFQLNASQVFHTGEGVMQVLADAAEKKALKLLGSGLHLLEVVVTDPNGVEYREHISIQIYSRPVIDNLLKNHWEGLQTALQSGDAATALSYFCENSRAQYQKTFDLLGNDISKLAVPTNELQLIYVKDDIAKYRFRRLENINGQEVNLTFRQYI